MRIRTVAVVLALSVWVLLASAGEVAAQAFGIGPRMSMVRSLTPGAPSTRSFGGTVRLGSSRRVSLELAADYRKTLSLDGVTRERERPMQASVLLFLTKSTLSPYLLGGYGIYRRDVDFLDSTGTTVTSVSDRTSGAHVGFGAELLLTRHAAFFVDYRYRLVRLGEPEAGAKELNVPFVDSVKLSHRGTMWTSGMAFYF